MNVRLTIDGQEFDNIDIVNGTCSRDEFDDYCDVIDRFIENLFELRKSFRHKYKTNGDTHFYKNAINDISKFMRDYAEKHKVE